MDKAGKDFLEAFGKEQTESDDCENYLAEVNDLQNKVDFLITLLRKNKIPIPDGPFGLKHHG